MPWYDDSWRDSYDLWKLATPPEYEGEDEDACPDCGGSGEVWLSPCYYPCQTCRGSGRFYADGMEPCPNCNVEWADQYHGDCDICHGARYVRRLDGPSEAEIARSQTMIAAVIGDIPEDDIVF